MNGTLGERAAAASLSESLECVTANNAAWQSCCYTSPSGNESEDPCNERRERAASGILACSVISARHTLNPARGIQRETRDGARKPKVK